MKYAMSMSLSKAVSAVSCVERACLPSGRGITVFRERVASAAYKQSGEKNRVAHIYFCSGSFGGMHLRGGDLPDPARDVEKHSEFRMKRL